MKLNVIMGHRQESYDGQFAPEAIDCWDEYTVDENPDGFEEAVAKAKENKEFAAVAVIRINISEKAVMAALYPKNEIAAEIVG